MKAALAAFSIAVWSFWLCVVLIALAVSFSWPFWSRGLSAFRYIGLSRRFWGRSFSAIFAAAGLMMAILSMSAEHVRASGFALSDRSEAMTRFETAARLFPLDFRIRRQPVVYCTETRWKGSGARCMAALRAELAVNPHSVDLHRDLAGFLIEADDIEAAKVHLQASRKLMPKGRIAVGVNVNPETR